MTAQHQGRHTEQVGGRGYAREPAAHHLPHHTKTAEQEDQPQNHHAGRIGQILDAGDGLEGQLEQQAGHDTKIHIVPAIVIGMIPASPLHLGLTAGGGVIGVIQGSQSGGRVLLQVQAAIEQAVRQRAVLLVHKADGAFSVPVGRVVTFGGQTGIARLPERHHHHKGSQYQPQHQSSPAVTEIASQPATLPKTAGRAKPVQRQQRQKDRSTAQRREIQRPGCVGRNTGHRDGHRILGIGAAVPAGRQRQRAHLAGQVQADGMGAWRLGAHLPGPEGIQPAVGFVGGFNLEEKSAVGVQRVGIVVDQSIQMQIVDGPVQIQKAQVGALLVQCIGTVAPPYVHIGVQIIHQLERLVAVGIEVGHIAHKHFRPQGCHRQQRYHKAQTAPPQGTKPCQTEPCPSAQRRHCQHPEGVKPHVEAGPMVGTQAEHPGGRPQARRPAQIHRADAAVGQYRLKHPEYARDERRCNQSQH